MRASSRLQTADALIAATAVLCNASALVTSDSVFRRVTGLDVVIVDECV